MTTVLDWTLWAPPLDPPVTGGLPADAAQAIADATWATDPHLCAALQWEAYAGMLPASPAVSQVATGAQSVTYSPPMPGGDAGAALAKAAWHRSLMASELSVPLTLAPPSRPTVPGDPWSWWPAVWWPDAPPVSDPVASFTYAPQAPGPNVTVTFNGMASTGGGGTEVTRYDWLLDGNPVLDAGPVVSWKTPAGSGSYDMTLQVTDQNGMTGNQTQVITV